MELLSSAKYFSLKTNLSFFVASLICAMLHLKSLLAGQHLLFIFRYNKKNLKMTKLARKFDINFYNILFLRLRLSSVITPDYRDSFVLKTCLTELTASIVFWFIRNFNFYACLAVRLEAKNTLGTAKVVGSKLTKNCCLFS